MKRILISILILLAAGASCYAQPSAEIEEYLREFPQRAAFNLHSYEFLPVHDTPAPSGFKPFYISHYGRHGSRSGSAVYRAPRLVKWFEQAAEEGILTPAGDSLLGYARLVAERENNMEGRLTPRGAREHEQLARRMYKRYKPVFRKGEVHAISSTVPRCLVSMSAFTSSLKACKKDLVITWDCGEAYQKTITRNSNKKIQAEVDEIIKDSLNFEVDVDTVAVLSRFFTDPERGREICRTTNRLISSVYYVARSAEAFDIDDNLFGFLPWDLVVHRSRRSVVSAYLGQCNSLALGDQRMPRSEKLALEIVRKADEAIAGAPVAADLCFGHDWPFLGICAFLGLEGYDARLSAQQAYNSWNGSLLCPFAANLQMIFYRNRKGEVLVKFLANERETLVPALEAVSGPYYRWDDVRRSIVER